jgi:hypothetical protein
MNTGRRPALTDDAGHGPTTAIAPELYRWSADSARGTRSWGRPYYPGPVLPSQLFWTGPVCTVPPHRTVAGRDCRPAPSAPGRTTVRAQFAARIRRLAVTIAPLLPVLLTLTIHGKRWI